jgi:hypothetical protein
VAPWPASQAGSRLHVRAHLQQQQQWRGIQLKAPEGSAPAAAALGTNQASTTLLPGTVGARSAQLLLNTRSGMTKKASASCTGRCDAMVPSRHSMCVFTYVMRDVITQQHLASSSRNSSGSSSSSGQRPSD